MRCATWQRNWLNFSTERISVGWSDGVTLGARRDAATIASLPRTTPSTSRVNQQFYMRCDDVTLWMRRFHFHPMVACLASSRETMGLFVSQSYEKCGSEKSFLRLSLGNLCARLVLFSPRCWKWKLRIWSDCQRASTQVKSINLQMHQPKIRRCGSGSKIYLTIQSFPQTLWATIKT